MIITDPITTFCYFKVLNDVESFLFKLPNQFLNHLNPNKSRIYKNNIELFISHKCHSSLKTLTTHSSIFTVFLTLILTAKEPSHTLSIKSRVSEGDSVFSSVKSSELTPGSEPVNSPKPNVTVSPTSSLTQKETESPDGSSTDKKTTRKARTFKWLQTSFKPS